MKLWYMSFATEEGFRGAAFVEAIDEAAAVAQSWMRDINPGGEVLLVDIPYDSEEAPKMRPHIGRLIQLEELESIMGRLDRLGDLTDEDKELVADYGSAVCEHCNVRH